MAADLVRYFRYVVKVLILLVKNEAVTELAKTETQENPREQKENLDGEEQEDQENKIEIYNKLQIIHYK